MDFAVIGAGAIVGETVKLAVLEGIELMAEDHAAVFGSLEKMSMPHCRIFALFERQSLNISPGLSLGLLQGMIKKRLSMRQF